MGLRFVWCAFFVVNFLASKCENDEKQPPHIIILMADDLGWNDVSFHGSNLFLTPNIDALAYNGIILNDFHSPSLCTPSRASLLTGKFPINIGMQRSVILEAEPWGLPLSLKILPQYLNSVGYESHLVGKWHLGFFERKYTPTRRGFQSFFGIWQGHHDYYTHESHETFNDFVGYDLRDDMTTRKDLKNFYTSDLLQAKSVYLIEKHDPSKPLFLLLSHTAPHAGEPDDPLQAPDDVIENFSYISDENKRKYAAMVSKLDDCVGDVIRALNQKQMLENSIILFMSDNGGPTIGIYANTGSNYPLRGIKATEFEGGTRVPAIIWSPLFRNKQRVSNIMMHMVDVLPTLCTAAGIDPKDFEDIDGISMWDTLLQGSERSPRVEYPYTIDPADNNNPVGAVRVEDWKYYKGNAEKDIADGFLWPGDKFPNSEFEELDYDTAQIIHSLTNDAFVDFHQRNKENIDWEPITATKILQLRQEAKIECSALKNLPHCNANQSCLLNLKEDPCEKYDYSDLHPIEFEIMRQKFEDYRSKVVTPLNKPRDQCANPEYWDGVWSSWYDFDIVLENMSVRGLACKTSGFVSSILPTIGNFVDSVFRHFHWW